MTILQRLRHAFGAGLHASKAAWDDFWYQPVGGPTRSGMAVSETTAANCVAFMACVRLVSDTLAALPSGMRRRIDGRRSEPVDHPVGRLLADAPNDRMAADEFWSLAQHHVEVRGNFFSQILRDGRGRVAALWPMHPDRMTVVEELPSGELLYLYRLEDGTDRKFAASEIFHLRGPSSDGIVGYSRVQLHRESIGLTMAAEAYGASHFGNGAQPRIVIKYPGKFKDEAAVKEFLRGWNAAHQGPDRGGGTAVLEGGGDISKLSITPEESQYLGTRSFQLGDMARIVGYIPPHLIGDVERSTSWGAGLEVQNTAFLQFGLLPRIRRREKAVWMQLLDETERRSLYYHLNVEGLLRGDSAARSAFYQALRRLGVFSANDILELEDRNPRQGGDTYWEPLDMRIVDAQGTVVYDPPAERRKTDTTRPREAFRALAEAALTRSYKRAVQDWPRRKSDEEWQARTTSYQDSQLQPVLQAASAAGIQPHGHGAMYLAPWSFIDNEPDPLVLAAAEARLLFPDEPGAGVEWRPSVTVNPIINVPAPLTVNVQQPAAVTSAGRTVTFERDEKGSLLGATVKEN